MAARDTMANGVASRFFRKKKRGPTMRFVHLAITLLILISGACHIAYANPSGTDCNKHPIQCALVLLQPAMSGEEARLLSNYIARYSKKYNVNPYRVVAIAMQESSLRNQNRYDTNGLATDIGIYQFNTETIKMYGMDAIRLNSDLEYATERMCWLLSQKKKYCSYLGRDAWSCYHSSTDKYRLKYINLVDRYYQLIATN